MLTSLFFISQVLVQLAVAQSPVFIGSFGASIKGDVGERATTGEQFSLVAEYPDGKYGTLIANGAAKTSYSPFVSQINQSVSRIHIKLLNRGSSTIGTGKQAIAVPKVLSLNLTDITINNIRYPRNSIFLQKDQIKMTVKDQQINEVKLNGINAYQLVFSQPRPNTSACDDDTVSNKVCFNLKGERGNSIAGAAELVDIGYIDNTGKKVVVYPKFDLSSNFDRFILSSAQNTFITSIFINLIDDTKVTLNNKDYPASMTLDMENFFVNGKQQDPSKLIHGSLMTSFFSKNTSPLVKAGDLERFNNIMTNGIMALKGEYAFALPLSVKDAPGCDDPSITNKVCFRLKGLLGNSILNQGEIVDIGYVNTNGESVVVHSKLSLTTSFRRFIIVPAKPIQYWYVDSNAGFKLNLINGSSFNTSVTLDTNELFYNGKKVNEPFKFFGRGMFVDQAKLGIRAAYPLTVINSGPQTDILSQMIYSGIFSKPGRYGINMPVPMFDSSICDEQDTKGAVCFRLRGDIGFRIPGDAENVKIAYQNTKGERVTITDLKVLSSEWERIAVVPKTGETISKVILTFLNDRCCYTFNGSFYDRNILFDMSSLKWSGESFSSEITRIGGPVYDSFMNNNNNVAAASAISSKGGFYWAGDYEIRKPVPKTIRPSECTDKSPNTLCWTMKGSIGNTKVGENEVVDVWWVDTNNRITNVESNYALSDKFEAFSFNFTTPIRRLVVNFKNDKMWTANGVTFDRNLILNITSFVWKGVQIPTITKMIDGPVYQKQPENTKGGVGWWSGEYWVNFETANVSDFLCDPANKVKDMICIELKGDQGEKYPNNTELVNVGYRYLNGTQVLFFQNFPMKVAYQKFALPITDSDKIHKIIITFNNDVHFTDEKGSRRDPNVRMNLETVQFNGKLVNNVKNRLRGPIYDSFFKNGDYMRTMWLTSGIFAWQGQYDIDLLNTLAGSCQGEDVLCFDLKGSNNTIDDVVSVQVWNGQSNITLGSYSLSKEYSTLSLNANNASKVVITHLNKVAESGLVTMNLNAFKHDGDIYQDTTACVDEVNVFGSLDISL